MPYITQERRVLIDTFTEFPQNVGELNYTLSQEIKYYIRGQGIKYQTYNDVIGVLECLKLEIYRRLTAPYEDRKIEVNGDVF